MLSFIIIDILTDPNTASLVGIGSELGATVGTVILCFKTVI